MRCIVVFCAIVWMVCSDALQQFFAFHMTKIRRKIAPLQTVSTNARTKPTNGADFTFYRQTAEKERLIFLPLLLFRQ